MEMDFQVIKEFLRIREALKNTGVIGLAVWDDRIHVRFDTITKFPDIKIEPNDDMDYPFIVNAEHEDIHFLALATYDEVRKYRLQPANEASPDGL